MKIHLVRFWALGGWFTFIGAALGIAAGAAGVGGLTVATGAALGLAGGEAFNALDGSGASGSNLGTSAPSASQTVGSIYGAEQQYAPSIYGLTQQYAPQYNNLQLGLLGNTQNALVGNETQGAYQSQGIQNLANQEQASGFNDLLGAYGSGAVQSYQAANPQLQALQGQLTNMALTPQNPVSQYSGAGSWASPFAAQVGQQVGAAQTTAQTINPAQLNWSAQNTPSVGMGTNATNAALQQTAQQQLALGTSISPQEQATVANQVLSNYNTMGRAEDPTAIAGLATGLDTYGQQLLTQRENNAASAATLQTGQQQLGQAAQQSNQSANLSLQGLGLTGATTQAGLTQNAALANQSTNLSSQQSNLSSILASLGLQGSALQAGGQQALTQQQANQQAQLSNAQYQAQLLEGASTLAQSTANPALSAILAQSQGLNAATNLTTQAGNTITAGNQLSALYNPLASGAFNSIYGAQAGANTFNAQTNQGLLGGSLSLLGSSGAMSGLSSLGSSLSGLFGSTPSYDPNSF